MANRWQHDAIEKQEGAQSLSLGGGRDFVRQREVTQERRHLGGAHISRMALVMKQNVAANPADVRLLREVAVVRRPERGADSLQQRWRFGYIHLAVSFLLISGNIRNRV